ncbi:MAG: transglutaminase domain-containing protein [Chloroflexi bacterium]|nr:transglutaminase domain-containing protein [Chloroflexota bacterium]
MTTRAAPLRQWLGGAPGGAAAPLGRRALSYLRPLAPSLQWVTFTLMLGVLMSVVWSVQAARWTTTPPLHLAAFIGFAAGAGLAKARINTCVLHSVGLTLWLLTVVWMFIAFLHAPGGFAGIYHLGERFGQWMFAARTGGISTDAVPFAVTLVVLTWALGYAAGWFTSRKGNVWPPVLASGFGLLTNLSYLPSSFWSYFYLYLLFAMLALAWASFLQRRKTWERQRIVHSTVMAAYGLSDAFWFGLAAVIIALLLPAGFSRPAVFKRAYEVMRWPVETFSGDFNRLFAGVPAKKAVPFRIFDDTLPFQGTIKLGDQVVFTAETSWPTYFRVRSYPTYLSQGWSAGATQLVPVDWPAAETAETQYAERQPVVQQVTLAFSPKHLPIGGLVGQSDRRLLAEAPVGPTYTIPLGRTQIPGALPKNVQALALQLRQRFAVEGQGNVTIRRLVNNADPMETLIRQVMPAGSDLVRVLRDAEGYTTGVEIRYSGPPDAATWTIPLVPSADLSALPPALQKLALDLRRRLPPRSAEVRVLPDGTIILPSSAFDDSLIRAAIPPEYELVRVNRDSQGRAIGVEIRSILPPAQDVLSVQSPVRLLTEDAYAVRTSVSVATPGELQAAGVSYPAWVEGLYLQLPDSVPQRVKDLARSLTANARTPYEKALAIQAYLKTVPYSQTIPPPGYNADGVDHFLFVAKSGYSEYYGSAMAVMLRTVGVPARLAVGYTFGDVDDSGVVAIRDLNAHGWAEVYFPRYGWVDFEPTPGQDVPSFELLEGGVGFGGAGDDELLNDLEGDEQDLPPLGSGGNNARDQGGIRIGLPTRGWLILVAAIAGVGLLLRQGLRWLLVTPRRVEGVYRKLSRLTALAGLGPQEGQTPREYGRLIGSRLSGFQTNLDAIVDAYSRRLYGQKSLTLEEERVVGEAWRRVRVPLLGLALRGLFSFRRRPQRALRTAASQ